ncbi:polysaccharide biosynthesis/export family protein [candidate division KSB1 bacterium]
MKHKLFKILLFLMTLLCSVPVFSQTGGDQVPVTVPGLPGSVNANDYKLGPGDELAIHILSATVEYPYTLMLSPEGTIIIPSIGKIQLLNLKLDEAKKKITEELLILYPDSKISISLSRLRLFVVYLTGAVEKPGSIQVNALSRISDVFSGSGGLKDWADARRIEIRHSNGEVDPVDYIDFMLNGGLEKNPFVYDGDEIFVPSNYFREGSVHLQSVPEFSGTYRYYSEESVFDFLKRIDLFDIRLDWEKVLILRENENGIQDTIKVSTSPGSGEKVDMEDLFLRPEDTLVMPLFRQYVYVEGEVFNPGEKQWDVDRTVSHYVGMAGRSPDAVSDDEVVVYRNGSDTPVKGPKTIILPGDRIFVKKRTLLVVKDWLEFITPIASVLVAAKAVGLIK